jgi:hypothetical protein
MPVGKRVDVQQATSERKGRDQRVHSVATGPRPEKDSEEAAAETGDCEFEGVPDRWHRYGGG